MHVLVDSLKERAESFKDDTNLESYVHGGQSFMDGISVETERPCGRGQSVAPVIFVCTGFPIQFGRVPGW